MRSHYNGPKFKKMLVRRKYLNRLSFELSTGNELIITKLGKKIFHLTVFDDSRVNINGRSFTFNFINDFSFDFRHIGLVIVSDMYSKRKDIKHNALLLNNSFGLNIYLPAFFTVKTDGTIRTN